MTEDAKKLQQDIVSAMKKWQTVEDSAILSTAQIIEKTDNPLIRLVAEIIQNDSQMHHRVQQFIADSITQKPVSLSPDELVEIWGLIDHHIKIEQQTIHLAEEVLNSTRKQQGLVVQDYLLKYMLQDENKHNDILKRLDDIKKGVYRSV